MGCDQGPAASGRLEREVSVARYRIDKDESAVSIEVTEAGGRQDELMEAFGECQTGQCSCPTNEYEKLASIEVEQGGDLIHIRLQPKPGEKIDTSEIAACLDFTTAKVAETNPAPGST
jgi:hypothetical protein